MSSYNITQQTYIITRLVCCMAVNFTNISCFDEPAKFIIYKERVKYLAIPHISKACNEFLIIPVRAVCFCRKRTRFSLKYMILFEN